jgi:hypothetical protein
MYTQSVHMKYVTFYCKILHCLEGTEMECKSVWECYRIKFLWPIIYSCWGQSECPLRYLMYTLFQSMRCKQVAGVWRQCGSYPLRKFRKSRRNRRHVHSILDVPPVYKYQAEWGQAHSVAGRQTRRYKPSALESSLLSSTNIKVSRIVTTSCHRNHLIEKHAWRFSSKYLGTLC